MNGDSFTHVRPEQGCAVSGDRCLYGHAVAGCYPVYAKYDVRYTTNLHRAGFEGTDKVNVPRYDIAPVISADADPATATVTPDVRRRFIKQAVSCISCRRLRSSFRMAK